MDLIDRIDEATKKPSFVQYFFAKKNFKKLEKQFQEDHNDLAMEYGNDILDDDRYYSEEDKEDMEISPDEAYDSYAHSMGYAAEYGAAETVILNNKSKFEYKRGDESDSNSYFEDFITYMGYSTNFVSHRNRKKKEDYWKMAEEEV